MKRTFIAATSVVILLGRFFSVCGQTETPAGAQQSGTVIGVIDSSRFGDEKNGIIRYVKALKLVDRQFYVLSHRTPAEKRLAILIDRMPLDGPEVSQAEITKIERLRSQANKEREVREAAYQGAKKEALQPIERDIAKELNEFARKRGIMMVIDVAKTPGLVMVDAGAEVTAAFIADFNRRNP